jgi:hypothetical protein
MILTYQKCLKKEIFFFFLIKVEPKDVHIEEVMKVICLAYFHSYDGFIYMRKHLHNRKKIQIKYELNKRFLAVAAFILD